MGLKECGRGNWRIKERLAGRGDYCSGRPADSLEELGVLRGGLDPPTGRGHGGAREKQ